MLSEILPLGKTRFFFCHTCLAEQHQSLQQQNEPKHTEKQQKYTKRQQRQGVVGGSTVNSTPQERERNHCADILQAQRIPGC